ncbi:MAG TPA: type I polyketide synthase [Pyrinomonadaceae bacterium]|nr:type I polyketide synthase [Pyrinomonadaceae bacterium]
MSNTSDRVAQLSPVKRALLAVEQMQAKLDSVERARMEPIAIVGLGCRFPGGADSPEAFWRLLRDGVDAVTEVPADRWDIEDYFDPNPAAPGKMYTRWGAFLEGVDKFDASFFGISPREAASMDPQQRLLLEVSWEALERAGQNLEKLSGSRTGVFTGLMNNEYFQRLKLRGLGAIDAYYGTGNVTSSAAGRISYAFGFQGPSLTLDTACSASLVATHLACQSLRHRECDMALAGGVNLILLPDVSIYMSRARTMAADGRCKTFDARADGYVRGEGCGVVVLKRLSDALSDGDNILALVRGSAVMHDGRSGGFTVPSGGAQQTVIRAALSNAGVEPSAISYVEAHGTGTPLGDPIELRALGAALKAERRAALAVGSVKTNIGHLEAAAGVAGLIKTVLALQHGEIPPHLHLTEVNPQVALDEIGATIPTAPTPWPGGGEQRRLAGVSSFGLTGTIAHVVLEEAPACAPDGQTTKAAEQAQLLTLSARDAAALSALARLYCERLGREEERATLADVCYTASARRTHHEHRLALVGNSRAELVERLEAFGRGETLPSISTGRKLSGQSPKLVFVFPGQGSQWVGMGRRLLRDEKVFRASMERCDELIREHLGWSLLDEIAADETRSRLAEIDVVQPALCATQISLAALWRSWGVEPEAVVGQSMGEVAAAHVAGALSLEDAVKVICRRSRLLKRRSGMGAMAAVELSLEETRAALAGYEGRLSIAVSNSPISTVVAGETAALEELLHTLQERGVFCRQVKVDIASHSPQMEPLREDLLEALGDVRPQPPALPIYSTVTGEFSRELRFDAEYWWRNLREPVLFSDTVLRLLESGHQTFLELSPHPIVLSSIQQGMHHAGSDGTVLPSLRREEDERSVLLTSLGRLYASGRDVNWGGLFPSGGTCVSAPTYPWQHESFWVEPGEATATAEWSAGGGRAERAQHPLLGDHLAPAHPSLSHLWEFRLDSRRLPFLEDHRVQGLMVLPATVSVEMARAAAAQVFGARAFRLASLEFRKALFVPEQGARILQLSFAPGADGGVAFRLDSRPADADEAARQWTLHTTGYIRFAEQDEPAEAMEGGLDAARARCPEEMTGADFYSRLGQAGNHYGRSFRGIETLWRREGEAVARLRLPEELEAEVSEYGFHPAVLDCCLQLLGATLTPDAEADPQGAYVPVAVEEVRVSGRSSDGLWCRASLRGDGANGSKLKGDVSLLDGDGCAVVEFVGVELQSLEGIPSHSHAAPVADWIYEPRWEEQALTDVSVVRPAAGAQEGAWLIFADAQQGVGSALAALLEERGERVFLVFAGTEYGRADARSFVVRPSHAEDLRQMWRDAFGATADGCREVVHLWSLDNPALEECTGDSLGELPSKACLSVVNLVQLLAETKGGASPRLRCVTQGAQAVGDEHRVAVTQSPLWGLGRTLAQEMPGLFGALLDLEAGLTADESARLLHAEFFTPTDEQQVAFRQGRRFVCRLVRRHADEPTPKPTRFRADASYLVTGGLGALGLQVARWMAEQGARRIILLGRTPLPPRATWRQAAGDDTQMAARIEAIRGLEALGVSVHLAAIDVVDESQLVSFLESYAEEGWPRIRGVVHAAGALQDRTLLQLDAASFAATWGPKVVGSWLLHRSLAGDALDFFILFSSAAALLGSPGQANYAAANSFMDALSCERRAQGLPALSINWGAWSEVGLAAGAERGGRLARRGFGSISPREGLEALDRLFGQETAQAGVIPIDWTLVRQSSPSVAALPLFAHVAFAAEEVAGAGEARGPQPRLTRDVLLAAEPAERGQLLADYLGALVSRILGVGQSALDPLRPLNTLGLDSLMAIEFKNAIETNLGVALPMVMLMRGPSIVELSAQVREMVEERAGGEPVPEVAGGPETPFADSGQLSGEQAALLLADFDALPPEQVDQLLATLLAEGR